MDFVSAHRGAIPPSAMSVEGQFEHPLVVRAKLEIAAACHAHGKTPSHCVVTEFKDLRALQAAATRGRARVRLHAHVEHPPGAGAHHRRGLRADARPRSTWRSRSSRAAQAADWAPIRHRDTLHDRASYRYFWQVLERAHRTSLPAAPQLPAEVRQACFDDAAG